MAAGSVRGSMQVMMYASWLGMNGIFGFLDTASVAANALFLSSSVWRDMSTFLPSLLTAASHLPR
jgi:hypothetical protein